MIPERSGFDSTAPKYVTPITVVARSRRPKKISVAQKKSPLFNVGFPKAFALVNSVYIRDWFTSFEWLFVPTDMHVFNKIDNKMSNLLGLQIVF